VFELYGDVIIICLEELRGRGDKAEEEKVWAA
jgi:hypothetical protein